MESLFSRLFKYRSSEKRIQQENFLTEIFAFLLENVPDLLTAFLNEFGITTQNQLKSIRVETQRNFFINSDKITPDITIEFSVENQNWLVFIENKVDALEGENQLDRYLGYLSKETNNGTNCALLYLTRYDDPKLIDPPPGVIFKQIKWWQVYDILVKFEDNIFVSQARLFMEERDLNMKIFSSHHITAVIYWSTAREMMERSLGDAVLEKFRKIAQRASIARADTNLRETGDYVYTVGHSFWLEIGYFIDEVDKNYLYAGGAIGVDLGHQKKEKFTQGLKEFENQKNTWKLIEDEEEVWIEKLRPVEEGIDIHFIQNWFLEILADVEAFQKANPHLLWN